MKKKEEGSWKMNEDLIELMKCKNCLNYQADELCKINNVKHTPDFTCDLWTEDLSKKDELKTVYLNIVEILKEFIDTSEDNYCIIALWIIGTYFHNSFETYPYLFINAMRGSGKTRLLKLIEALSWEGDLQASLTDAVLFRTKGTLLLDEFENPNSKEKNSLRELLNTAYKKGGKVKRMRKVKGKQEVGEDGRIKLVESQEVEVFETFRPIVMANISGMEEVLADRCITIILEKSSNKSITRKVENFTTNKKIRETTLNLRGLVSFVSMSFLKNNTYQCWNEYVDMHINDTTTLTTLTTLTTPNDTNDTTENANLFSKIFNTGIDGRNLELSFPLLFLAAEINCLDSFIEIIQRIIESKREEDRLEGRDVTLYDFISKQTPGEYYKVKELTNMFAQQSDYDPSQEHWLNYYWFGRALRRLNLIKEKKRLGEGREVVLDIEKAKEKLKIFK